MDAVGNRVTYQYDATSRRTVRIDGRGLYTSYSYDPASRLTGQQYQDATRVTMAYDADSRRTILSDWYGPYTSSYDPVGRLSSVVNPAGIALTYGYDAVGQRAWLSQPTGLFTYTLDPVGRILSLVNPENKVSTWQYDAASRVTANLLANGTQASNTYDHADRLLVLANITSGGTTLSSFNYMYNSVGNRTKVAEANGDVVSWSYDPTYQLTNEQRSGASAYNITYAYDGVGNRTLLVNGGATTTSTYNAANELATSQTGGGTTTYVFDGSGNLLTSQAPGNQWTTNTWDAENRLKRVALPSGIVNTLSYNGDGQRVQKQDSSGTTNHLWDGQNILLETNASNIVQVVYTLEPLLYGRLISQWRGGVASFYIYDAVGSTRGLANASGAVTDSYLYDSFGNRLAATGTTSNPYRFIGRLGYYCDSEPALVYVRTRTYQPFDGRFLSRDPVSQRQGFVTAVSPPGSYAYALSNPSLLVDPSGMDPWTDMCCPRGQEATCWWLCGFSACLHAWQLRDISFKLTKKLTGLDPKTGSQEDAIRHCIWQCLISALYSEEDAQCVGVVHELCDNTVETVSEGHPVMDLYNNQIGQECGAAERQYNQGNPPTSSDPGGGSTARRRIIANNCGTCCLAAYKQGRLIVLYPVPPVLPL
jgi:RHS repeat-associated protein